MSQSPEAMLQNEGSNGAGNQQNNQAPISPELVQQRREELDHVARMNPAAINDPQYVQANQELALLEQSLGIKNNAQAAAPANNQAQPPAQNKNQGGEEPKKNPFSKSKAGALEKIDDIEAFIKQKYSVEEPNMFFQSVDKLRTDNEELTRIREEHEELMNDLANMPEKLRVAMQAVARGEDWEEELGAIAGRPDYSKKFEKNDADALVRFYFPGEYKTLQQKHDSGDYDEDDFKERVDLLRNAAKPLFEKDKGAVETQRAAIMKRAEEADKALKSSVTSSVDALKEEFPDFSQSDIQKIRQVLVNGNINSLFMEKNGTFKKEAARRVAFALYGDNLLEGTAEAAENRGISKANEEIVLRGQKEIADSKTQQNAQAQAELQAVAHLTSMNSAHKKNYLHNPQNLDKK